MHVGSSKVEFAVDLVEAISSFLVSDVGTQVCTKAECHLFKPINLPQVLQLCFACMDILRLLFPDYLELA